MAAAGRCRRNHEHCCGGPARGGRAGAGPARGGGPAGRRRHRHAYRRCPRRPALLRAVVVDALQRTAAAARCRAGRGERRVHRRSSGTCTPRSTSACPTVIPAVLATTDLEDDEVRAAREVSAALAHRIVDAAHADGSLAADVTFGDIGTLLVRLSRPLPDRSRPTWTSSCPPAPRPGGRRAPASPGTARAGRPPARATATSGPSACHATRARADRSRPWPDRCGVVAVLPLGRSGRRRSCSCR